MMRKAALLLSLFGALALNACGSSGGGGTPGTGGTTGGGGTSGGGSGGTTGGGGAPATCGTDNGTSSGETCNTITPSGPCVVTQLSSGTAPTPAGGTISAGTYNLTSDTIYGADGGANQGGDKRETLVVSSVTAASFMLDQAHASGSVMDRSHGAVVVAGSTVTYTPTCPPPGDGGNDNGGSAGFTAMSTSFTLIQSKNGVTDVSVYTKS